MTKKRVRIRRKPRRKIRVLRKGGNTPQTRGQRIRVKRVKKAPASRVPPKKIKIKRLPKPTTPPKRLPPPTKHRKIRVKGKGKPAPIPGRIPGRPQEWLVNYSYESSGRSVDFLSVAFKNDEALMYVNEELRKTSAGRRMIKNFRPTVLSFKPPRYRDPEDIGEVEER